MLTKELKQIIVCLIIIGAILFLVSLIRLDWFSKIYGQETKQIASWNNSKTTDLGNGQKRFEMTMARSYYIEQEKNVVGDIIVIRNISGTDTISYIPSAFSNYYGEIIGGNWVDNFDVNDSTFILNIIKGDIEVVNDTVITNPITARNDTIEKHIRLFSKGSSVMKVLNIKGFDVDGKVVKLKKLEKDGKKIKGEFEKEVKKVDPTWSWQPDAVAGLDNYIAANAPTTNLGTGEDIRLGGYSTWPDYCDGILIKISVLGDSIPVNAIINTAKFIFTYLSKTGTPPAACTTFVSKMAWLETQSTWNSYTTGNTWQVPGALGDNDIYKTNFDVTSSGIDWAGVDTVVIINCITQVVGNLAVWTNNGFLIRGIAAGGDNQGTWASSDHATAASRPKTIVDYTVPPPTAEVGILKIVDNGTIKKLVTDGTIRKLVNYP